MKGNFKVFVSENRTDEFEGDGFDVEGVMVRIFKIAGMTIPGQGQPVTVLRAYNVTQIIGLQFDENIVVGL